MTQEESLTQVNSRTLRWTRRDWAILGLLSLGVAFALWPYWGRAPHLGSDTTMAIYRAFELDRSIGQGVFYPRLAMDFNFTYGAPLLEYRPPLTHYVLVLFYWVVQNWITAAKMTATLELLVAALGMYVFARWLLADRRAALVGAMAYLFAPYLLGDINERGAIGEAAALAVLPWLFWAVQRVLRGDGRRWLWLGALLTALLVLAHNIVAFFALPFLLLYICLLAWREGAWPRLPAVLVTLAFGLGLSAFYWMPALFERDYARIEANMLRSPVTSWLAPLGELVQRQLAFDYWGRLRFRLSLWQGLLAIAAIPALLLNRKGYRTHAVLLGGITAGLILLQLKVSAPFWEHVPLVGFVQFPWRLLGIAAFCLAPLAGFCLTWPRLSGLPGWILAAALAAVMIFAGTRLLGPQSYPYKNQLAEESVSLAGLNERGRSFFTLFSDFLPVGVHEDSQRLVEPRPSPDPGLLPMAGGPSISVTGDRPFRLELHVQAGRPFTLRVHRFFFPGWQVYAAHQAVPTGASGQLGLVTADLPAGDYPVVVQFGATAMRLLAGGVTLLCLLAWLAAGLRMRQAWPPLGVMGATVFLALALMLARHGLVNSSRTPVAYPADFGGEIRLLGYDLPQKTWRPGENLPLRLYWLAPRTPTADYTVFIHLIKQDDKGAVAQSDSLPVLGTSPTTRWEPGEIVVDDQTLHLGEDVAPGKYTLLMGVYRRDPVQNLAVSGAAQVLPGDRLVLTGIEVPGD